MNLLTCTAAPATKALMMTRPVYQQIESSIGCLSAETGGMLGGNRRTGEVTHFRFDGFASRTGVTYSPDTSSLNRVLDEEWNPIGVQLLGFVHSHPGGPRRPSGGDLYYAANILKAIPEMREIFLPIVLSKTDQGRFELFPFSVRYRSSELTTTPQELVITDDVAEVVPALFSELAAFVRVRGAYDLARLEHSRVIAVGCGGATSFLEDLVRAGVGEVVLIDPDVVSESNLATQQVYRQELGLFKVDVIAERLRDINPLALTVACPLTLDDLDDALFCHLVSVPLRSRTPEAVLLCGMTDNFYAQARVNRLALNFGLPSLCAQMYQDGAGSEVTFTHPDTTATCHRCILKSRYAAYLKEHFVNNVTSNGSPYQSTARLNALKQYIALALLHHGTSHPRWGDVLTRLGNRNLAQIRHRPDCNLPAFDLLANANGELLVCDDTVWLPQLASDYACPDCKGQGDLATAIGTFTDTRTMRT